MQDSRYIAGYAKAVSALKKVILADIVFVTVLSYHLQSN
jgi:hypothetical protein